MVESSPNGIDLNVIDFCTPVVFRVRKDDDDDDDDRDLHLCALSQHPRKSVGKIYPGSKCWCMKVK